MIGHPALIFAHTARLCIILRVLFSHHGVALARWRSWHPFTLHLRWHCRCRVRVARVLLLRVLWCSLISGLLHWRADTWLMSAHSMRLCHSSRIARRRMMTRIPMTLLHYPLPSRWMHMHVCRWIRILCTTISHSLRHHAWVVIRLLILGVTLGH